MFILRSSIQRAEYGSENGHFKRYFFSGKRGRNRLVLNWKITLRQRFGSRFGKGGAEILRRKGRKGVGNRQTVAESSRTLINIYTNGL